MKKITLIILMIVISLILATEIGFSKEEVGNIPIFSTKDGSLVLAIAIGDTEFNGNDWAEIPDTIEIGAIFTGSSGITYILKEYEHEPGEKEYEEKVVGITTIGIWIILEE
ncbi:MAG: hypothetical protein WC940_00015 [Candidatus Paceibacterota bacterium]|jgi:hypothetical protein